MDQRFSFSGSGIVRFESLPIPGVMARQFVGMRFSVPSTQSSSEVYKLFLSHADWMWIPVVDEEKPVGVVSRQYLIEKFSFRYSHDLFSRKSIRHFMFEAPLMVGSDLSMEGLTKAILDKGLKRENDCFIVVQEGRFIGLGSVHDWMSELARREEGRLFFQANFDQLTGLANRSHFYRVLNDRLSLFRERPLGLVYVDLDRFKSVNDTLGHLAGDQLLMKVGERLKGVIGKEELGARLGGDEFAIIVLDTMNREELLSRVREICGIFSTPFAIQSGPIVMSASFGCALYPEDGRKPDDLVHRADQEMYRQKRREEESSLPGLPSLSPASLITMSDSRTPDETELSWVIEKMGRFFVGEVFQESRSYEVLEADQTVTEWFGETDSLNRLLKDSGLVFLFPDFPSSGRIFRWLPTVSGETRPFQIHVSSGHVDGVFQVFLVGLEGVSSILDALLIRKYQDPLTGLKNRTALYDRLDAFFSGEPQTERQGALILIDVDRFSTINETIGVIKADQILCETAVRLNAFFRPEDTVCRVGEDSFAVFLQGFGSRETLVGKLSRLLSVLSRPHQTEQGDIHLTVTIGISLLPEDGQEKTQVIRSADAALFVGKKEGGNRFVFYQGSVGDRVREDARLELRMPRALENREFEVHYQPIWSIRTHRILGVEALIRWNSPDMGMVSPARFVPLAEESGLIGPIGRWVLKQALIQVMRWKSSIPEGFRVSVNVSPREFRNRRMFDQLKEAIDEVGADPSFLTLELTEGALMSDISEAILVMKQIKDLGIAIAIDDFGTGYSSLASLRRFPVDTIKVDQSFVRGLPDDPRDRAMAASIISLAHHLGLSVVAEGVETTLQKEILSEEQCDAIQGYLVGYPVLPEYLQFTRPESPAAASLTISTS